MHRRALIAATLASALPRLAHAAAGTPVVLELFTSQGCSSCPPADALLGTLTKRPAVIGLAWHVDYWDRLGWHDRYASSLATARQQAYARQLGNEVFTPALVIGGAQIVVGSDRHAVETAIDAAPTMPVQVTLSRSEDGTTVDIGAGDAVRYRRCARSTIRSKPPTSGLAKTKANACVNTGLCVRWRHSASGTALPAGSPLSRPVRTRARSSWCSQPISRLSARPTSQPSDQCSDAIVWLISDGTTGHSEIRNQPPRRTAIQATGA